MKLCRSSSRIVFLALVALLACALLPQASARRHGGYNRHGGAVQQPIAGPVTPELKLRSLTSNAQPDAPTDVILPEPRPDLPDETGFGQHQPPFFPQEPSIPLPSTTSDAPTPLSGSAEASIGETTDIDAAIAGSDPALSGSDLVPVPRPDPIRRPDAPNPRFPVHPPPHRPQPPRIHPIGPEQPPRIHPVGPELPPADIHPVGPEVPPADVHPVGPEVPQTDPVSPPSHTPMMGEGGEKLPPTWVPDASTRVSPRGMFERLALRMRQLAGRAEESTPMSVPPEQQPSDADASSVVSASDDGYDADTDQDGDDPVVPPPAPELPPTNPEPEPEPEPQPDPQPEHQKDKHHGGRHHGDKDKQREAKRAAKRAAHHEHKLRKALLKLRNTVTSAKDLLHLRLEVHRLESELGVASELQVAGQLPPVPAYGGPAITDPIYEPIGNDNSWNAQLAEEDGGKRHKHHKMNKHMMVATAVGGSVALALLAAAVCLCVRRKRARRCQQQQQLNSLLPQYAPTADGQVQMQSPQQNLPAVPVAEPVYPAVLYAQQQQQQQRQQVAPQPQPHYNYTQLASAPMPMRVQ